MQTRTPARLAPLLVFAACWSGFLGYWLDDAYILFRYARNWAEGMGPVFNPGEAVEGYTSFLWMAMTAVPFAALPERAALLAIEGLGLALGAFVVWRVATFPAPDGTRRDRPLTLVLAASPVFVINAADGMETALQTALLVESARAFCRPTTARDGAWLGFLTAGAVLTRPEALPLLVLWPAAMALLRTGPRAGWVGGFALAALPPVGLHLAWRIALYGHPVPNTFYAKATGALLARLQAGFADLGAFLVHGVDTPPPVWLWLGLLLAGAATAALLRSRGEAERAWLAALWTPVVFRGAFDLWAGGETMGVFRFLAPALPTLFVLADEGLRTVVPADRSAVRRGLLALGLASALVSTAFLWQTRTAYRDGLDRAHVALGRWLAESQPPGTWMAMGDAGAAPFFSRLPMVDLWGLNDATVARLPGEYGHKAGVAGYALSREPGIVVLWNLVPARPGEPLRVLGAQPFDREIAEHPRFARDYRFVRQFTFREADAGKPNGYYLAVFERRPEAGTAAAPAPGS